MILRSVLLITLLMINFVTQASSVWKVTKDGREIYLGGTIHLLSAQDYPLPGEFNKAFQQADKLVFETDIATLQKPELQLKAAQMMMYQGDKTIHDVLSDSTLKALETHLKARNIPLSQFAKLKPGMLSVTLSLIEFQVIGLTSEGVDKYFSDLAVKENKPQAWLETPEQQIAFLANMGEGEEDELISYTLRDMKELPGMISKLKAFWRAGDMQAMAELSIEPFKRDYLTIYNDILLERNKDWVPQIEKMFSDDEVEFVLVGALHLAGEDSVIAMLKDKGYQIEKF